MINRFVTITCLAILTLELLLVLANIVFRKRPERIAFLRSFKKGKCAIIYVTAIPLYCIGYIYAGEGIVSAVFNAISKIVQLVVLRYDVAKIEELMKVDPLYNFSIF